MPTQTATQRKLLPPATGWVRWVGHSPNGDRLLEICPDGGEPTTYEVEVLDAGYGGYNLYQLDAEWQVVCYTITHVMGHPGVQTCTCPDATHRPERRFTCKHVRGLRAGLRVLAQTEPF